MSTSARILIVEDEAISAMWLKMELNRRGYTTLRSVASGSAAVQAAEQDHPDVVLMDIRLAGSMDGIEAARAITAHESCTIIFMSGYSDQLLRLERESIMAAGYLSKPVQMPELERLLAQSTKN